MIQLEIALMDENLIGNGTDWKMIKLKLAGLLNSDVIH